ncbi:3647_t:CDS:2, partial [Gigaspora margarita]
MKALKKAKELVIDNAQEEIKQNLRALQSKLGTSQESKSDETFYSALKKDLDNIDPLSLKWKDPLASMVLSDDSTLVENLKPRQKRTFLALGENMKCDIPASVNNKCEHFINNFNMLEVSDEIRVWNNPAFSSSMARSEQSEGTYITDVVMPLLRASLSGLPNVPICLSSTERQSLASKTRKNGRIEKKPDLMALKKYAEKTFEIAYVECSRVVCAKSKKTDDSMKLWRETLDGLAYVNESCRPKSNQFGIVGIQVAGEVIYLNVMVKDANGIPRYFHLDQYKSINKCLLMEALEQAYTHPPRNVQPSTTVSSPRREGGKKKNKKGSGFRTRIMELEQNAEKAKLRDIELNARIMELERSIKESEKRFAKLEQKQLQNNAVDRLDNSSESIINASDPVINQCIGHASSADTTLENDTPASLVHTEVKSLEEKKMDDFHDSVYKERDQTKENRYFSSQRPLPSTVQVQEKKSLSLSDAKASSFRETNISETHDSNVKVNNDKDGQELAQLFSDAETAEGKMIKAKQKE